MRVAWLGHASLLVQFDGVTILTDPIFSKRCSPLQFVGPKRFRDAPCKVSDLPPIDIVIISHNHYDHMDYYSIVDLQKKEGSRLMWFVPMGDKRWMEDSGCTNVREMTWWQEEIVPDHVGIKVVCVPCQHWSSRKGYLGVNQVRWIVPIIIWMDVIFVVLICYSILSKGLRWRIIYHDMQTSIFIIQPCR